MNHSELDLQKGHKAIFRVYPRDSGLQNWPERFGQSRQAGKTNRKHKKRLSSFLSVVMNLNQQERHEWNPLSGRPENGGIAWRHARLPPSSSSSPPPPPPLRDEKQIVTITILQSVKISASRTTNTDPHRFVNPRQGRSFTFVSRIWLRDATE